MKIFELTKKENKRHPAPNGKVPSTKSLS